MGDLLDGNSCPLASHLKEQLGFELNAQDKGYMSLWAQSTDVSWFVDFEGVHKGSPNRNALPNRI
jgi:hypothetical protein